MKYKNNRIIVVMLAISLFINSMWFVGFSPVAYAAENEGFDVLVRIEDENYTKLPYTKLRVDKFDIKPFITGDSGSFSEPAEIVSAHALIEAVYYENFGKDPTLSDITDVTDEKLGLIKEDLLISYSDEWGLGTSALYGNSKLVMSAINNLSGNGIGSDVLKSGDEIVFYPWGDSNFNNINYAYFSKSNLQAIKNVPLILELKYNTWTTSGEPVTGANIYIDGELSEYTTDNTGKVTINFDTVGEYIISASKGNPNSISRPYCKVTVKDTGLQEFKIFNYEEGSSVNIVNIIPYLDDSNSYEMDVENNITTFGAIIAPLEENSTMSAIYTKADGEQINNIVTSGTAIIFPLEEGRNNLKLDLITGDDLVEYNLTINRKTIENVENPPLNNEESNIDTIIDAISQSDIKYDSDWIISMYASGKSHLISQIDKDDFLATVLIEGRKDESQININKLSKMIIALTAMGIDPRYMPDVDGMPIDLVDKLSNSKTVEELGEWGIYTAPYILLAYDSGNYEVDSSDKLSRDNVIPYILNQQSGSSWIDVDTTAIVLSSLSSYQSDSEVMQATENALNWISQQQGSDGSFSSWGNKNSNSASSVIIALSSLGIDCNLDQRFINNNSVLDSLMTFKTDDNKFGYIDNTYNAFATLQGFQAITSYKNLVSENENGGNIYKFNTSISIYDNWPEVKILSDIIVTAPKTQEIGIKLSSNNIKVMAKYITETGEELIELNSNDYIMSDYDYNTVGSKTVEISYNGKTTSFIVTVVEQNDISEIKSISITVRGVNGKTIIRESDFVIDEGNTTVMDALKTTLGKEGLTLVTNAAGTYIESIEGIGEFDLGKNSGWLYSVNGTTPSTTSAAQYLLDDGDVVIWYLSEDYTKDLSSESWAGIKEQSNILELKANKNGKIEAIIEKETLESLVENFDKLIINSNIATLTFDKDAIGIILDELTDKVELVVSIVDNINLTDAARKVIGERSIYDLSLVSGNQNIREFGNGKVKVSIPYAPSSEEDVNSLVIYYIDDNGDFEIIKDSKYDEKNKAIVFNTNHFSQFAVGYNHVEFNDIDGHWSESNINFLASREIIKGKKARVFMPDDKITRAEFVTILANMADVDLLNSNTSENLFNNVLNDVFNDVTEKDWFKEAVIWAAENDIVNGYNGKFRPDDEITRQEMAVIIDRFITGVIKINLDTNNKVTPFSDSDIAEYAKSSVLKIQKLGIINGKTLGNFEPTDYATRGETAKIIASLMDLIVK